MTTDTKFGTFDPDKWNLRDAILASHKYGFGPFFGMGVSTDEKNSSRYMIKVSQVNGTIQCFYINLYSAENLYYVFL